MTLTEFIQNHPDLTDEAFKQKMLKVSTYFRWFIENNEADNLRAEVDQGLLEHFSLMEEDDAFGTEGMSL